MSAPVSTPGLGAQLLRVMVAGVVSVSFTLGSLWLVSALNDDSASTERTVTSPSVRRIPIAPPPSEPEPTEQPPELAAEAEAAPPSQTEPVPPPPVAPPAASDLAPAPGVGTVAIGAIGPLPSVTDLPASALQDAKPETRARTSARPTHRPAPTYPALAQRRGIEGFVTVRLRIDERGRVTDAVVVEADPPGVFDRAALDAARRYRFAAARQGNEPVATTLQQTIRFELQ